MMMEQNPSRLQWVRPFGTVPEAPATADVGLVGAGIIIGADLDDDIARSPPHAYSHTIERELLRVKHVMR